MGVGALLSSCALIILGSLAGALAAYLLDRHFGATSQLDAAAMLTLAGAGLILNIYLWIRRSRSTRAADDVIDAAVVDVKNAFNVVLRNLP